VSALMLHKGAVRCDRLALASLPLPEATKTWTPIGHGAFVEVVTREMRAAGLEVIEEEFGVWQGGLRFFGVLTLGVSGAAARGTGDYSTVIGLRNSNDREFRAGLCLGSRVFVCDNLAFSNEVVIQRSHTVHILRDLPGLVSRGVAQLTEARGRMDARIEAYKGTAIYDQGAHDFLVRAVDRAVLPVTSLHDALKEWRTPRHKEFEPRTVWSLFNAVTEVSKGTNPALLTRRTEALHGLADQFSGLALARAPLAGGGLS